MVVLEEVGGYEGSEERGRSRQEIGLRKYLSLSLSSVPSSSTQLTADILSIP